MNASNNCKINLQREENQKIIIIIVLITIVRSFYTLIYTLMLRTSYLTIFESQIIKYLISLFCLRNLSLLGIGF